jgi:hypothetical protein
VQCKGSHHSRHLSWVSSHFLVPNVLPSVPRRTVSRDEKYKRQILRGLLGDICKDK